MSQNLSILLILLSPAAFAFTAVASWLQPGIKPKKVITLALAAAVASIALVAAGSIVLLENNLAESGLLGYAGLGFSIRLDALSALMLGMIVLLSFIIIKFSVNYLDGDPKQGAFIGRLAATIASVQLLVLSGNLGLLLASWVLTSVFLHRLLLFYPERPGAQVAAKKKFILARLADTFLLAATGILYTQYDTGNLDVIFQAIRNESSVNFPALEVAALFLVLAAMLKSAQFPSHGWLIEVMETPTPVSALLHAGLLNAGPFLIIRMAFILNESSIAPVVLITVGGLTALFASVAYLTQTSVKTALGYSSVGHMGFSLLLCGLGVYSAAMLHLVAHSFYKAHAFLSSGSVIDVVKMSRVKKVPQKVGLGKVLLGISLALALYISFALFWGIDFKNELALLVIGVVIVLGVSQIITAALAGGLNGRLFVQALLLALLVTSAFFSLESGTHYLIASQIPDLAVPGTAKLVASGVVLLTYAVAVYLQLMAPQLSRIPFCQALAVHVRNGFYANAYFDKLIGAFRRSSREISNPTRQVVYRELQQEKREIRELEKQLA